MEALSAYSKFAGCYDRWQQIRKQYSLHWTNGNESLQAMQRFFNTDLTLESMCSKIREMIRVLPEHMAAVVRFAVLTGLRPSEACESVRLISGNNSIGYYNQEQQCLCHYLYPDIFLRTTKKAYLSYLSLDNYHYFSKIGSNTPTWNAIRSACKRRNIDMNMRFCRRIFASWLIREGIDSTTVDLLSGRVPSSVLARHYLTPDSSLKNKVLEAVYELQREIK